MHRDIVGSVLSGLCLCHCLLPPLLMSVGVLVVSELAHDTEWFHSLLLLPILLTACWSFYPSVAKYRYWQPVFFGLPGIFFIYLALISDHNTEALYTVVGTGLLLVAHWKNYHFKQKRTFNYE